MSIDSTPRRSAGRAACPGRWGRARADPRPPASGRDGARSPRPSPSCRRVRSRAGSPGRCAGCAPSTRASSSKSRDPGGERLAPEPPDVDRVRARTRRKPAGRGGVASRAGTLQRADEVVAPFPEGHPQNRDGDRVAHRGDRLQHGEGQPAGAVVESSVDDPVGQSVADPLPASAGDSGRRGRPRRGSGGFDGVTFPPQSLQSRGRERFAVAARPGQRTIRSRTLLPRRAARPRVRRGGSHRARPRNHDRRPALRPPAVAGGSDAAARALVGISCMHALEYERVLEAARAVRRATPEAFIVVGGHAAAAFPRRSRAGRSMPCVWTTARRPFRSWPTRSSAGSRSPTSRRCASARGRVGCRRRRSSSAPALDRVAVPARSLVERDRNRYHCLLFRPVWLVETARGCPYRCNFCSVWQLYGRSFRERSIGAVVDDLASVGENVFIADDLFWNHPERSLALAEALEETGREEAVAPGPDAHGPRLPPAGSARGVAPPRERLRRLLRAGGGLRRGARRHRRRTPAVWASVEAARISRSLGYGVTGNFLVDPDWDESRFRELWDFVAEYGFQRAGYTILTPLPGTELFQKPGAVLAGQPWFKYDMHHVLWEPRLGARRFFELYAETWRRSILNTSGEKSLIDWIRQVQAGADPYITRILLRTQRMMRPQAYLRSTRPRAGSRPRPRTRRSRPPDPDRARSRPAGRRNPLETPSPHSRAARTRVASASGAGARRLARVEGAPGPPRVRRPRSSAGRRDVRGEAPALRLHQARRGSRPRDGVRHRGTVLAPRWRSEEDRGSTGVSRLRRRRVRQGGLEPPDRSSGRRRMRPLDRDSHPLLRSRRASQVPHLLEPDRALLRRDPTRFSGASAGAPKLWCNSSQKGFRGWS